MATKTATKIEVDTYTAEGKKSTKVTLDASLFGVEINEALIAKAALIQQKNARRVVGNTKTRSERRGGGRKPWKQKGTGRARQGSIRSPQWKKGGVVFGPRSDKNFGAKLNRQEKRQAMACVLSAAAQRENGIMILEKLEQNEIKTKPIAALLEKLPVKRKALLVIPKHDKNIELSVKNMARAKTQLATNLNVVDLIAHEHLIMPKESLDAITKLFSAKKPAVKKTVAKSTSKASTKSRGSKK